jgi:hypothetical protein
MQRRIAGIEIMLRPVPGGEIDVSRTGCEQYEPMPKELRQALALGLGLGDLFLAALEQPPRA